MEKNESQNLIVFFETPCIGILAIRPYLPDVLCLCKVTENDGKAREAILERYMIVLND